MKKKTFRSFSIVFSVMLLLCAVCGGVFAEAFLDPAADSVSNTLQKIHFYFDELENYVIDSEEELAGAAQKVNPEQDDPPGNSQIQITVQFVGAFAETQQYAEITKERGSLNTTEEVHAFRKRLNAASKEYHKKLFEENADALKVLEYDSVSHIAYTPFVVVYMDADKLTQEALAILAEDKRIANVCVAPLSEVVPSVSWDTMLEGVNAYDVVHSSEYTGEGINIGICEAGGVCDVSNPNLVNKNIALRATSSGTHNHATFVTSIIAIMAPDANFYVAQAGNEPSLEWFIDNNCDIINCSFSYVARDANGDGIYDAPTGYYRIDQDGVFDYQVYTHDITVIVAAGNKNNYETYRGYNPNGVVLSPGLAYNVITVGGVKRTLSWFQYDIEHDENSGYYSSAPYVKPEISAFMQVDIPNIGEPDGGTSYAAPQVAATVALMMEKNSVYIDCPEFVKSALMLHAQKTDDYTEDRGSFDDRLGAGLLNAEGSINQIHRTIWGVNPSVPAGNDVIIVFFELEEGDTLTAALAWDICVPSLENQYYLTDYYLVLEGPSSSNVASSQTYFSNVEMIRYTVEEAGEYTIYVMLNGTVPNGNYTGDRVALTFNVER